MTRFTHHLTGKGSRSGVLEVDGYMLERWFLKAHCGFLASGYVHSALTGWPASKVSLQILFGQATLARGCGLYFLSGSHQDERNALGIFPLKGPEPMSVAGIVFLISGFPFVFLLIRPWLDLVRDISPLRMCYRPEAINIRHGADEREVRTGWKTGEIVEIDISGPF